MFQQKLRVWTPEIQQAHNEQRMARGGDPGGAGKRGKQVQEMKQREMNPIAGAVKRGADYASNLLDQGPSVRDVTSNLVGAIPFVGPDLRKAMEGSTTTVPVGLNMASNMPEEGYQYGEPAKYKKAGIETYKMPTTDLLDAMKVSDLTGTAGLSRAAESAGYGEAPDLFDVLDTAGVGAGLYGAAKLGAKGAKMVGKGALKVLEQAGTAPRSGSMAAQRGVIKMPGGNFLNGRVEKDVAPFKASLIVGETPAQRIPKHEELLKDPSLNQDQLDRVKYQLEETKKDAAVDKWVDSNLSNYIKKQLGTPDDPVRALAEQGITHNADLLRENPVYADKLIMDQRRAAGFPEKGMAQSPLAKAWEYVSDSSIASHRAGDIQEMPGKFAKRDEAERKMIAARDALYNKFVDHLKSTGISEDQANFVARETPFDLKARTVGDQDFLQANTEYLATHDPMMSSYIALGRENPWISKVAPETQLYSPFTGDLGFDHIIDVLKQDVAEGRIRPDQLNKVSMEQAVRRTYEYDQEMAKKMRETQAKVTEGMPVYKEYPEGYKWIELAKPKDGLPEGYKILPDQSNYKNPDNELFTMFDEKGNAVSTGASEAEAMRLYKRKEREEQLDEALKYEGNTMGHCVGGYCPDVLAGRSRIYSLRDAKGEPHVTVEVKPKKETIFWNEIPEDVSEQLRIQGEEIGQKKADEAGYSKWGNERDAEIKSAIARLKDDWTYNNPKISESITQIKGKGNRAPKEEYLPFVQDFVKGGNWRDVGDFRNTGLIRKSDLIDKFSPDELDAVGSGEYLTKAEVDDLLLKALRPPEEGMKAGGEVHMSGGGLLESMVKAAKTAKAAEKTAQLGLKIKPPSDNILNVRQANFQYPKSIGNQTVKIDELSGGVRLNDPTEAKRVKQLADKIASPDGYISRIIVDQNNNVIEGQHRLEALRQLGVQDVPVYKIEELADTMPVSNMESAVRAVGPIHPDHAGQLVSHALEHISEGGMESARQMDYGKFQKYYNAALDAIGEPKPDLSKAQGGEVHMSIGGDMVKAVKAAKTAKAVAEAKSALPAPAVIPNLLKKSTASEIGREERARRQAAGAAEEARVAAAKQMPMPIGYVKHTEKSPNPHVGYRYEAVQHPGIQEPIPIDLAKLEREKKGASLGVIPWDSQSRNVEVSSISGEPLTINLDTHGGQPYALDEKHLEELIGGSSAKEVADAIKERDRYAIKENLEKGGTGEVVHAVTTMGKYGENYAHTPSEFAFELINRRLQEGRLSNKDLDYLNNLIRTQQDKKIQRDKGIFPYANFAGFETPEGLEQIYKGGLGLQTSPGNLRKAIAENLHKVKQQELLGFNSEDFINATSEPSLRGVDKGYIGGTLLSNDIGSAGFYGPRKDRFGMELAPSSGFPYESPYSTDFSARYYGQLPEMIPLDVVMHRQLAPLEQGFLARPNKKPYTEKSLRNAAIGSLEKSNEGVSQIMDDRFFQDLSDYMEALKKPLEKKKGGLAQAKKPKKVARHGNTVSN